MSRILRNLAVFLIMPGMLGLASIPLSPAEPAAAQSGLTPYAQEVLADGPVAYWNFDEGAGTVAADSINSYDGALGGPDWISSTGVAGSTNALSFNGTGDFVDIGTRPLLQQQNYTIETWFRTDAARAGVLMRSRFFGIALQMTNAGQLQSYTFDTCATIDQEILVTDGSYADGDWHHAVLTLGPDAYTLYVDGAVAAVGEGADTTCYGISRQPSVAFGRDGNFNASFWQGDLDEFAWYDAPLTPERVLAHFCAGAGPDGPGCTEPTLKASAGDDQRIDEGTTAQLAGSALLDGTASSTDPTAYRDLILGEGPVAYWPVDATDTAGLSDVVADFNAPLFGGASIVGDSAVVGGDSSLNLEGAQFAYVGTRPDLESQAFTFESWARQAPGQVGRQILVRSRTFGFSVATIDGELYATFNNADGPCSNPTGVELATGVQLDDDAWHHVAFRWEASEAVIFLDGAQVATFENPGPISWCGSNIGFGRDGNRNAWFWQGDLDEVAWYHRPLTDDEVALHHCVGTGDCQVGGLTYDWEQVSGPAVQLSSNSVPDPTFTAVENGTYRFRFTATAGDLSDSDIVTITVDNVEPTITAGAEASPTDGAVLLTSSFTDPGILDTHTVSVDWGDGTTGSPFPVPVQGAGWGAASLAHVYEAPGIYTATVTFTDDDGGSQTASTELTIVVGGTVTPVPGYALWADGDATDSPADLRLAGRDIAAADRTNTNDEVIVNGDGVTITNTPSGDRDGFTAAGPTTETGRNHDATPTAATPAAAPVEFDIADYRPSGRAAVAAGDAYVDLTTECAASTDATWAPTGPIAAGLYWAPCDVDLAGTALTFDGAVTIASDAAIRVSGRAHAFPAPFVDSLTLLAAGPSADEATLKISGDSHSFTGAIAAPVGDLWISGIDHNIDCGAFGQSVVVTGQGHRFDQSACPAAVAGEPDPNPVVAPPVVVPTLSADVVADTAVANPGETVTFTASITNDGSRAAIPALLQLRNPDVVDATITDATAKLEILDVATSEWRTIATGTAVGLVADTVGVTTDGMAPNTVIAPDVTATIGVEAIFDLGPAQLAELEPAVASDVRISIDVTASTDLEQTLRLDDELFVALQAASDDVADLDATITAPGAPAVSVSAPTVAPGETISESIVVIAPAAAPIADGESNDAFAARLEALDATVLSAGVTGTASGAIGTVPVPGAFTTLGVDLPVIRVAFDAPASQRAGNTVTSTATLTNTGSVTADLTVDVVEAEAGPLTISGLPTALVPGATATGSASYDIPADRTTSVVETLDVSFAGAGLDLALRPETELIDVLVASNLLVTKLVDLPPGIPAGQATYLIEVRNTGDDPLTGVILTDTPDPILPLVAGTLTTTRGTVAEAGGTITADIGDLAANDAALIEYRIDFASTDESITAITNQATVTSNELPDVVSDDPTVDGVADPTVFTFRIPIDGGGDDVIGWFGDPSFEGGIFTPEDGSVVTEPTDIAVDFSQVQVPVGRTVETWRLVARPFGDPDASPVVIAQGSGTPPNSLGTFDPSVVENGPWGITLEMIDDTGALGVVEASVIVEGQLKLGRFSLTYEDMNVAVGGLPVSVLRTYDTLDRNQVDDFGYGWDLDIANFTVASNGPLGFAGWEQYSCGSGGFIFVELCYRSSRPHFVTVTWPNGQVESFDFTPDGTSTFFAGQAIAAYSPRDARTTSTLSPVPGDSAAFYDSSTGIIRAGGFGEGGTYDPQRFILTDRFGTEYLLDVDEGLIEAIDRNGNSVRVTDDGVFSSNGPSITFARDTEGRITTATGPDGEAITYTYDAVGDLVAAIDQNGNTYAYGYGNAANGGEHYLTSIEDPGAGPARVLTYDDDGRLTSATDAEGNVTQIDVDIDARTEIVTSPDGLLTTITNFDDRGNATEINEIYDGVNHVSTLTYDELDQVTGRTDPNGNTWAGSYDADRNLLSFTDAENHTTVFTYDAFGFPTSVTDGEGDTTGFAYDAAGNLVTITDARGGTQTFTFDGRGNQLTRTDEVDRTWSWTYDSASRVRTATDPRSNVTRYAYDGLGRVTSITAADNGVTFYGYDDVGNLTSITDPLGRTASYVYDERDRLDVMTDPAGAITRYAYDDNDRLVSRIDPTGRLWQYGYAFDRLDTETAPDFGTTSYAYDGAGRLAATTDPLGRVTSYGYDSAGRRVSTTSPISAGVTATSTVTLDGNGRAIGRTNAEGETTGFAYDALGRMLSMTDPLSRTTSYSYDPTGNRTSMTNAEAETTTWVYDLAGQLTSTTNAEGETTAYTYDNAGNLESITDPLDRVTTYGYDAVNRQSTVVLPSGDSGQTVYNQAGEATRVVTPAGYQTSFTYDPRGMVATTADALGNTVTTGYDLAGRRTSVTDARGNTTTFTFDPVGRLESETDPLGGTVSFGYDVAGQRTSVTDANAATRTFGFDDGGRMTSATDALGRTTTYSYDLVGRRTGMTDARGVVTTAVYDDAGQMTGAGSPNETRTYSYDLAGRRVGMTDASGATTFVFDDVGRLTNVSSSAGVVAYGYNPAGERVSMTQPAGTITYGYDLNGYLATLEDWRGDTVTITNDPDGRVIGVERSNGVDTAHGYDTAGRLDQVAHTGPSGVIDTFTYTLDPNGNRTAVASTAGTETYVLDELNRLTGVTYADATSEAFGYDDQGNRTSFTDRTGATVTYSVDAAGQLVSDSNGTTYTYDQAGNLTGTSDGDSFVWDDYGRLVEANTNGVTQTYGYDGADVRVDVDGDTQLWDRNGLPRLIETTDDSFVHAGNQVARSGDDWLLADAVGSIRTTTDATGAVNGTTSFTAYGEPLAGTDTYGFAGEQQDPTGLQHLRARNYNPAFGRFLSVDPVQPGSPGTTGWNLYTYTANNPTTWTDPTGQDTLVGYNTTLEPTEQSAPVVQTVGYGTLLALASAYAGLLVVASLPCQTGVVALCGVDDVEDEDSEEVNEEEIDPPEPDRGRNCLAQASALATLLNPEVHSARPTEAQNAAAAVWCVLPMEIGFDVAVSGALRGPQGHAERQIVDRFRAAYPEGIAGAFFLHTGLQPCDFNSLTPGASCANDIAEFRADYAPGFVVSCTFNFRYPDERVEWRAAFGGTTPPVKGVC